MSEAKFTPGPWRRLKWGGIATGAESDLTAKRVRHSSCWVTNAWCESDSTSETIANDHLIAAAPELYEALDQILDDMGNDGLSCCQAAKDQARAALAKARGETP